MYAVVGFVIAGEVLKGEKVNTDDPVGAITFICTHSTLENAEKARKEHMIMNEKSNIKLNFLVLKQKSIVLLNLDKSGIKESENNEKIDENLENLRKVFTEMENLAMVFSTLLHSLGVKKYSNNLLGQADVSIVDRRKEMKEIVNQNKEKISELKDYYKELITKGGDQRALNQIINHLNDLDGDGFPKCLSDNYIF